jgi:hypothetical protein
MFRALLAHSQETITSDIWYISYVLCQLAAPGLGWKSPILVQLTEITRTQYTKWRCCSASWGWASHARNMSRSLIRNQLTKKCITLVSLYWYTWCTVSHCTDILWCTVSHYTDILWCTVNKTLSLWPSISVSVFTVFLSIERERICGLTQFGLLSCHDTAPWVIDIVSSGSH